MAFLDLQGMKSATRAPGGSNVSLSGCNGQSGVSVSSCSGPHSLASILCN